MILYNCCCVVIWNYESKNEKYDPKSIFYRQICDFGDENEQEWDMKISQGHITEHKKRSKNVLDAIPFTRSIT